MIILINLFTDEIEAFFPDDAIEAHIKAYEDDTNEDDNNEEDNIEMPEEYIRMIDEAIQIAAAEDLLNDDFVFTDEDEMQIRANAALKNCSYQVSGEFVALCLHMFILLSFPIYCRHQDGAISIWKGCSSKSKLWSVHFNWRD